jgi:pimeloyl-ACP methyl ester carboxylesterase
MHFASFPARDGTLLAAHWAGDSGLPVVLANGLGGTFVAWQPLVRQFLGACRFYSWDYRGLYRSGRPADRATVSVPAQAEDLLVLMDHFGIEKTVLAGWSMGVQLSLEFYRRYPDRVQGLILLNGTYGNPFRTAFKTPFSRHLLPPVVRALRRLAPVTGAVVKAFAEWPYTVPIASTLRMVDRRIDRGIFHAIAREFAHLDMDLYLETLLRLAEHDAGDMLSDVEVPVLIVAGDRDMMTPQEVTARMVQEMSKAELFVVPRGTHYCLLEYPELVGLRVERFLKQHFGAQLGSRENRLSLATDGS